MRLKQGVNKLQEEVRKELKEKKSVSLQKWKQYLTVLDKLLDKENQLKQTGSFTSQLKQTGLQKGG